MVRAERTGLSHSQKADGQGEWMWRLITVIGARSLTISVRLQKRGVNDEPCKWTSQELQISQWG
jgi:hypothetical protein